jgi:hypothetical protein
MVRGVIGAGISARRLTGMAGVAWVVVTAVGVTSFSLVGNPPDFGNANAFATYISGSSTNFLIDAFATGISAALLGVFVAGLSTLLLEGGADGRLPAAVLLVLGAVVTTLLAVVGSLETATVLTSGSRAYAGLVAPLFLATQSAVVFLYFPGAGFLAVLGQNAARLRLPGWIAWTARVTAVLLAIASLAVFGGTGSLGPLGLLQVLVGFLPSALTFLVIGVRLLRD